MPAKKNPVQDSDALAAFDALKAEPRPLTDGAIRCMLTGCDGVVKREFVFTFAGSDGVEHKLGTCNRVSFHLALKRKEVFSPEEHRRAMDVKDRAMEQNAI